MPAVLTVNGSMGPVITIQVARGGKASVLMSVTVKDNAGNVVSNTPVEFVSCVASNQCGDIVPYTINTNGAGVSELNTPAIFFARDWTLLAVTNYGWTEKITLVVTEESVIQVSHPVTYTYTLPDGFVVTSSQDLSIDQLKQMYPQHFPAPAAPQPQIQGYVAPEPVISSPAADTSEPAPVIVPTFEQLVNAVSVPATEPAPAPQFPTFPLAPSSQTLPQPSAPSNGLLLLLLGGGALLALRGGKKK